jgi:hypothetical protein
MTSASANASCGLCSCKFAAALFVYRTYDTVNTYAWCECPVALSYTRTCISCELCVFNRCGVRFQRFCKALFFEVVIASLLPLPLSTAACCLSVKLYLQRFHGRNFIQYTALLQAARHIPPRTYALSLECTCECGLSVCVPWFCMDIAHEKYVPFYRLYSPNLYSISSQLHRRGSLTRALWCQYGCVLIMHTSCASLPSIPNPTNESSQHSARVSVSVCTQPS